MTLLPFQPKGIFELNVIIFVDDCSKIHDFYSKIDQTSKKRFFFWWLPVWGKAKWNNVGDGLKVKMFRTFSSNIVTL